MPVRAVLLVLLLALAAPALAPRPAPAGSVEQSLRANEQLARQGRQSLTRLTDQERALHGDLAAIEDELGALRARVAGSEAELKALDARIARARAEGQRLDREQQAAYADLGRLARALWPLRVADLHARSAARGWDEADRRFAWGAALYDEAHAAARAIEARSKRLTGVVREQRELRARAEAALAALNADKDASLDKRLDFVRRIREVRAERLNQEQALEQIMGAIEELEYRMQAQDAGKFEDQKGRLPWPVDGRRLDASALAGPGARGQGRGAGFSTAQDAPVRAVFPGRVVVSDLLRGYGHVVILSHGDNWYTLYAFLREDAAGQGSEVASGAVLGHAGYYPAAKGPGVYFELRTGQKAINPVEWLAQRP